jgi:hypothetical protein
VKGNIEGVYQLLSHSRRRSVDCLKDLDVVEESIQPKGSSLASDFPAAAVDLLSRC